MLRSFVWSCFILSMCALSVVGLLQSVEALLLFFSQTKQLLVFFFFSSMELSNFCYSLSFGFLFGFLKSLQLLGFSFMDFFVVESNYLSFYSINNHFTSNPCDCCLHQGPIFSLLLSLLKLSLEPLCFLLGLLRLSLHPLFFLLLLHGL